MINKKITFGVLFATSLVVGQNAIAKEKTLPKTKPYLRVVAKALEIAADKTEGKIIWEFFDSASAWAEKDPRPQGKKMLPIFQTLSEVIKTPKKSTLEEKEKALENFIRLSDEMTVDDKVTRFNDQAALAKAANILVNNAWSLPGQYLNGLLMAQRLITEGLAAAFGDTENALFKELKAANIILKRAWNHSEKEVTNALMSLEKNSPIFLTDILKKMENVDKETFKFNRDFKEYQECLAYMPQPQATTQA